MKIVAIGGGEIRKRQTLGIDRFIVELAGKRSPRALFIPTASGDPPPYCATFDRIYGKALGCRTDHLLLLSGDCRPKQLREKIGQADLVYVGGGNTLRMMKRWRQLGVDRLLTAAGKRGTILAALSAGAICWHRWGHSDSRSFSGRPKWPYIRVRGLGLIDLAFCAHFDEEKRQRSFPRMVARYRTAGIACESNAAVYYCDGAATCLTSRKKARVCVYQCDGRRTAVTEYTDGEPIQLPATTSKRRPRATGQALQPR